MPKYKNIEQTYICQFCKPQNFETLKRFAESTDKSPAATIEYYGWVRDVLMNSKAWGISGVNGFFNKLTEQVVGALTHKGRRRTTAGTHARATLATVERFKDKDCVARYAGHYALGPVYSNEELESLYDPTEEVL